MFASNQPVLRKILKKLVSSQNNKRHLILTLHGCRSHTSTMMNKGRKFNDEQRTKISLQSGWWSWSVFVLCRNRGNGLYTQTSLRRFCRWMLKAVIKFYFYKVMLCWITAVPRVKKYETNISLAHCKTIYVNKTIRPESKVKRASNSKISWYSKWRPTLNVLLLE